MAISIEAVNSMDYEEFIKVFGNVVENCDICAAGVWAKRPFNNLGHLRQEIEELLDQLPKLGQEGVLRLHPDLAGRLARSGGLTAESAKEQMTAQLNTITKEEQDELNELNELYKKKFGVPFVICARDNKKQAILEGIRKRLESNKDDEIQTGINEVKKIMYYRLCDIVVESK